MHLTHPKLFSFCLHSILFGSDYFVMLPCFIDKLMSAWLLEKVNSIAWDLKGFYIGF
ncbi:unnamed protein product [Arabidopsis halleri]